MSDSKVRDLNLYQLQLAPASVLHLKFDNDTLNRRSDCHPTRLLLYRSADVDVPAPLDPVVLTKAEDLPLPPSQEEPEVSSTDDGPKAPSGTDKAAIPRWLKLGSSECYVDRFSRRMLLINVRRPMILATFAGSVGSHPMSVNLLIRDSTLDEHKRSLGTSNVR